jgi:atlastin
MLDEEPVIISERDFTPTPSQSPVLFEQSTKIDSPAADHANASSELNTSAIVSDAEEDDDDGEGEGGTVIMSPGTPPDISVPTPEDVNAVDELGISIADMAMMTMGTDPTLPPPPARPSARQIVSIGTETDSYAFAFHEQELNAILSKIPPGWKVCVVSVVGAFRTGKSFLLSWFLRYLEAHSVRRGEDGAAGSVDGVPRCDDGKKWFERVHTLNQHEGSFDWRGGKERNTTGMWMWNEPYFLPRPSRGDEVAVLLVDTQGMFDHETTVGLTAAIFGLSTLLSSYQIYNVDKRIQEDNLQQLALFSEYGRMAFEAEEKAAAMGISEGGGEDTGETERVSDDANSTSKKSVPGMQPFQRIEFLVRDWQNFDTEDETDIAAMEAEMSAYLEHVTAERAASDLKETRDQITSCFVDVSCFMMTHPGFGVIKNKYEGDVSKIEPLFMRLLDRYCRRVFNTNASDGAPCLEPKTVRGRELSAVELATYIKSYAQMFEEIGANFPKAETMLEATSKANNSTAINASVEAYTELMNVVAGPHANDYHRPSDLLEKHKEASFKALKAFDEIANFGNRKAIEDARTKVLQKIAKDYDVFLSLNEGRNPLLGMET